MECFMFYTFKLHKMSSTSPNEDSNTKDVEIFFHVPKYSWETESHCDEFTQEIPTYSWEFDTSSPIYNADSTSTVVPDSQCLANIHHIYDRQPQCLDQKRVIEADQPCQMMEKSDIYGASTSNVCKDEYYGYEFAQSPEKPNLNLDVDAIKSELCDGFIDSPPKDHYYDYEFAQSPDKPNINLDVDAIKTELCDGFLDSPQKKKKGKKITKWF